MKSLSDLKTNIAINNTCFDGDIEVGTTEYPDNEWGIMLAHYDSCVRVYRSARVETKEQSLRRDQVAGLSNDHNADDWDKWRKDNPNLPIIPYNSATYKDVLVAIEYFSNPPPPLRDCLVALTTGEALADDDWPYFLLMYGEFREQSAMIDAWEADFDELHSQRSRRKNNNDRYKTYVAEFIAYQLEVKKAPSMASARVVLVNHIRQVLSEEFPPPDGWQREEFAKFLGLSNDDGLRLKKQFGQNFTKTQIEKWLLRPIS